MKESKKSFQRFLQVSVVLCIAFLIGIFIDGRLQLVEARTTTVDGIDFITVPRDSLASDSSGNNKGLYAVYSDGTIMPAEGPIDHGPHASGGSAPCYYQDQLGLWAGKWDIWGIFDETLTGYVYAPVTGTYKFLLSADDQAWLTFNGAPLITTPYNAHAIATIDLVGGTWYPVQIKYQNRSGSNWFSFWWNIPEQQPQKYTALLDLDPDIFSVTSGNYHTLEVRDNFIKAYLELPETINPEDVTVNIVTLLSNGVEIAKAQSSVIKDKVLEFSFPLTPASVSILLGLDATWVGVDSRFINVDAAILPAKTIDLLNLTVAGSLKNGDTFTAADAVQVIQGKKEDPIISATVDIHPEALNTCSRSDKNAVTVRIELPSEYHEQDIDFSSIRMSTAADDEPSIAAQQHPGCISHKGNALMVKFDRQQVIGIVAGMDNWAILKIRGTVAGRTFEGWDSIKIINKKQCGNKCKDKD